MERACIAPERVARVLACALITFVAACERPPERPHVLLVVLDSTRRDDTSYLDPARGRTPRLDGLAQRGLRFSLARSLYTWTVPSHVSLFTGCEVAEGAYLDAPARGGGPCDQRAASIFGALRAHGYRTYAYSANTSLRFDTLDALADVEESRIPQHAFMSAEEADAILAHYDARVEDPEALESSKKRVYRRSRILVTRDARSIHRAASEAIGRHVEETPERPFLLFVNFNDAHDPYHPAPPYDTWSSSDRASSFNGDLWDPGRRSRNPRRRGRELSRTAVGLSRSDQLRARDLHLGEVAYADHHLGLLLDDLDRLDVLDHTAVVVTADHGEAFGEEGRMAHGGADLDVLLDVPLVMVLPGVPPARIEAPVDHRDVKPTLMAYLGLPDPYARGRNLLPLLLGEGPPVANTPAAVPAPSDSPTDPQRRQALERELRSLGYLDE